MTTCTRNTTHDPDFKYPDHVISKNILNRKLQGPAPNSEGSKNVTPFVTTYCPNIDKKTLM